MMLSTTIGAFKSVNSLIEYLFSATGTATVVPYLFLAIAYFKFKMSNGLSESTIIKSKSLGIIMCVVVIGLGVAGFLGQGWGGWQDAETTGDVLKAIFSGYGVTVLLVLLGYLLVLIPRLRTQHKAKAVSLGK